MSDNNIFSHYKINDPNPTTWPAQKDFSDSEDDEGLLEPTAKTSLKPRYSVLERNPKRTSVPGAQRTKDGLDNLVQRDEPDPLGRTNSVVNTLKRRNVPIDDDNKLRNRYMLSSTTFSPSLFLSEVHSDASTQDLIQGLDFLTNSIEKKSASLKVLVESNFEKFVNAKDTIDRVYQSMVNPGGQEDTSVPSSNRRAHSRQASRQSAHFRKSSGPYSSAPGGASDKRKNALIKEQEYGTLPIKVPLLELKAKVDEVWGPALGGREREQQLKLFMSSSERQRSIFDLGSNIAESIKRRDYDMLVDEYVKAKRLADDARAIIQDAQKSSTQLDDGQVLQLISTARMWSDIEDQIDDFKRDVWRRLTNTHITKHLSDEPGRPEEYMELIKILLELGVDDNPIWIWLYTRYDHLKRKVETTFERSKVEIEILRRRLAFMEKPSPGQTATHLKAANSDGTIKPDIAIDSPKVVELWDHIFHCLSALLSSDGGVLGEVLEFWETAQAFINGTAQKDLSVGIDGSSRKHHRLSMDGVESLTRGAEEVVQHIRNAVLSLFTEPPTEDLTMLLSPIPTTPLTPKTPKTPKSAALSTFGETRFRVDLNNIPPPSPLKREVDKFAFWPPNANSLSGVHYLSKLLILVSTACCEMAALEFNDSRTSIDSFKTVIGHVRERCLQAVCAAWSDDCEQVHVLEDWTRSTERPDLTKFPSRLMDFEGFILTHLQKILYISEVAKRAGTRDIVIPPSNKLLQMVRSQFVGGMYKVMNGIKEHAEEDTMEDETNSDGLTIPARDPASANVPSGIIDASNKKVRILLTLSNIQGLRMEIVPHLVTMFENNFTIKLTEENESIRDVLAKIDSKLFHAYVEPLITSTDVLIKKSIASPTWAPTTARPTDARPYIYQVLLSLVLVHTEISTTSQPLTSPILKHLLEKYLISLMEGFKQRPRFNLSALMQATLDVEFMAQTLANYTTDRASNTQSEIYVLLDQLTDNDARVKLQQGLQELRSILKGLREGTRTEFACFKRQRAGTRAGERPPPSG